MSATDALTGVNAPFKSVYMMSYLRKRNTKNFFLKQGKAFHYQNQRSGKSTDWFPRFCVKDNLSIIYMRIVRMPSW